MRNLRVIVVLALLFAASACRTSAGVSGDLWPMIEALPDAPPADLERSAPTTVLRRGSDGFVYVVGGLPNTAATGSAFLGRYSGEWPLQDLPRPPLVSGWVLKRFGRDVALVSLSYQLPDSSIDGLEITWERGESEELGKGITRVVALSPAEDTDVGLSIGEELGVQPGDIYGVFEPVRTVDDARSLQMARRLLGICLVDAVADDYSTCRLWRGSSMVPGKRAIAEGDVALFLEHTYGRAPRDSVIQIARVKGASTAAEQQMLSQAVELYIKSLPLPNATVELYDGEFDATAMDFHRAAHDVAGRGMAQVIVGATVAQRDGRRHLILNYTGVGPAVGPGLVAAPPEGGIDLGPVDAVAAEDVRAFVSLLWSAVLVYRGQTSEALMHLHLTLGDRTVRGPARWHARDQYAMRWAALGLVEQALWLVLEDEAVAKKAGDQRAYLNALGTRVRLYDMLDLPTRALAASTHYLDGRQVGDAGRLGAMGMQAEMLLGAGRVDEARRMIEDLRDLCPKGCDGELAMALAGVYVAAPDAAPDLRVGLLDSIIQLAEEGPRSRMASARTYQGLEALGEERFEDALVAFLEAERLFAEVNDLTGLARTKYFMFITQMSRQEPQEAFELAIDAIERDRELGDFEAAARTYELLSRLYTNFDGQSRPGPWLGAARDVLGAAVQAQLARGNFAKTGEALLGLGAFLTRLGEVAESQVVLQRGVLFSIRSTRFDVAAMCHLWLGIVARENNDAETFIDEIQRARLMGAISGDPTVLETIERVLRPPDDGPDTPTQVL